MTTRRQATLFLPTQRRRLDAIRARVNPAQAALIGAHVTLCREDEVDDWDALAARLAALDAIEVVLAFGAPVRDGALVTLPVLGSTASFDALRAALLPAPPRRHRPHVTLVHPRNGACTDAIFDELVRECRPFTETFREVALIEQVDGGVWRDRAAR